VNAWKANDVQLTKKRGVDAMRIIIDGLC